MPPAQSRFKVLLVGLALAALVFPSMLLLEHFGRPELVYPVIASQVAILLAIRGRWDLRGRWWFWATMTVISALHTLVVLRVPWKAGWVPARVTMFFAIVDLAAIYGVIHIIEKVSGAGTEGRRWI